MLSEEMPHKRKRDRKARRRGASAVEFAVVSPVLFLLLLAVVQFAGLLMSQNVLTSAAREGGRVASLPTTVSRDTVVTAVEEELRRGCIQPDLVTVNVTPTALVDAQTGDELRVSVSVPIRKMGWIWAIAPQDAHLSAEITYARE
jgi:Flp pilus assembly protein TadG